MKHRQAVAAGRFYPDDQQALAAEMDLLFARCLPSRGLKNLRALIVPHAGYIFSGEVAASAYNQISKECLYKRIFVLASSHCAHYSGASIYKGGHYLIPGGKVKVDLKLASQLVEENPLFHFYQGAHDEEHSLEVQLPFLRYKLGPDIEIIPIVFGTQEPTEIEQIAQALQPYFTEENLFVISTDFSHYPAYDDAVKTDHYTAVVIAENDPKRLLQAIGELKRKEISGLVTGLCGWTSVLCLLYLTQGSDSVKYHLIQYKNSGDAEIYGSKNRVVGYHAMAVTSDYPEEFTLSVMEKVELLGIARESLTSWLKKHERKQSRDFNSILKKTGAGVFISLYRGNELRGCMGRFSEQVQLTDLVNELTVSSSGDYRFDPLEEDDLMVTNIEISVLSPLKRIYNLDEFELGRHGIYIRQGSQTGTFLPQVAAKTRWSKEEFISRCSRDKAHLGADGWKTAELYTYEAIVFSEKDFNLPVL